MIILKGNNSMKKRHIISATLVLIMLIQIMPLEVFANTNTAYFTKEENAILCSIDESLCDNASVIALKKAGKLDKFVKEIQTQYKIQEREDMSDRSQQLKTWGINLTDTLYSLEIMAQHYLDEYYSGIKIGSSSFYDMVKNYFYGDSNGIVRRAENDPKFGLLYVYMCLYYNNIILDTTANKNDSKLFNDTNYKKTIQQFINDDFDMNFKDTQIPIILRENLEDAEIQSSNPWPDLNGDLIQSYARKYSKTDAGNTTDYFYISGGDCTNFVSQALFYGGLYKTFITSDKTANGYVETEERWFYFNNNTSTGHSVSTSWVRVTELYNYLSPHYATLETKANSTMTPYLNKGFVLQGKHFFGGYSHSVITTITNGADTYCAHTSRRCDEPISTFYDGFYKCRVIQTY